MRPPPDGRKRSLILAGGGIRVAFQAGVLQVWLDEASLEFDHVDAASGGVFNLAMLCQEMSGLEIADHWRNLNPRAGISFNASELPKLLYAESLFTLDGFRRNVFTRWGLDWARIRASALPATFNVCNFSRKELQVIEPKDMTEDLLVACVSLPMWFPPVRLGGDTFIDAVYLTDANIEEAIRRGADELWVIWTVSDKDEWHPGFVATYFQIIETCAVGHYRAVLKRIEANNAAIAAGGCGEYGRRIEVRELKADGALHYLVDFSQDRLTETVNLGVQRARVVPDPGDPVHAAAGPVPDRRPRGPHPAVVRRGDEGLRDPRRAGPRTRCRAGPARRHQPDVPPDDRHRRRQPLRHAPGSRHRSGRGLRGLRRPRRHAAGRARPLQPLRRRRGSRANGCSTGCSSRTGAASR